jgi:anti-sigma B factor antagonist
MSETHRQPALPAGDDQITLAVHRDGSRVVIEVGGEVDMLTSPQLRSLVLEHLGETTGVDLVVLDLDAVTFLGTSGLAVLIEVREAAHMAGVELRLACTARRVLRPLTIAGLVSLFDIHESQEAALAAT